MDRIVDQIAPGPIETRVVFRCQGGHVGTLINNRWLEVPCRRSKCRRDGVLTVHVYDLFTARESTVYRTNTQPGRDSPEGVQ